MIVYKLTNKINGKAYIGQTVKSLKKRYAGNWHYCATNDALKNDLKEFGQENFSLEEIARADNKTLLYQLEIHHIRLHNTVSPYGYNQSYGGYRSKHTPETKSKIAKTWARIGGVPNKGRRERGITIKCRVCNTEFYTYLLKGRPQRVSCSDECSRKFYGARLEATNMITGEKLVFESSAFAKRAGFCDSKISNCITGKRKSHKGYSWRRI